MNKGGQHRIVVGVSGSRASIAALHWAADEARDRHARLEVIRAADSRHHRAPYAACVDIVPAETASTVASRELASIVRTELGEADSAVATAVVTEELPARALLARSDGADLLVLGTHAPRAAPGGAGPPVGPVIRACLTRAPCPVVIVSPADEPAVARS